MAANREQRRNLSKAMGLKPGERMTLNAIMVQFDNGKAMYLDITKVQLVDRETGEALFQEVIEGIEVGVDPAQPGGDQSVEDEQAVIYQRGDKLPEDWQHVDIPEGQELVVKGKWSGLRPKA